MDFEIGNILYIVITLVAILVGLLGRKKKPAGQGTEDSGGESKPGFLENLEKAFRMGEEEPGVVDLQEYEEDLQPEAIEPEPVVEKTVSESYLEKHSLVDAYEQILQQRGDLGTDIFLSEADTITEPLEVIHLEDDQGTDYFEVVRDFNAATAVVYSAIINRLDY